MVMVERKFDSVQKEIFNFSPTSNNNKHRCIITRLGCELLSPDNSMVCGGTKVSHKCLGAQGSQISYNVPHIKGEGFNVGSNSHGQHDSPVILNENDGHQKPRDNCDQQRNLAILFETKDCDYCQVLTRVNEYRSRQEIQANRGFQPMETKLNDLQEVV